MGAPQFSGPADAHIEAWIKETWPVALKLFIPRFTEGDFAELSTTQILPTFCCGPRRSPDDIIFIDPEDGNVEDFMARNKMSST